MAQLPGIGIQLNPTRLQTSSVPDNPIPGAVRKLAQTTEASIDDVMSLMMKERQMTNDKESINYFFERHSQLRTHIDDIMRAEGINDPQIKLDRYKTGMNDLISEVTDKYPYMSELANSTLVRAADSKMESMNIDTIKKLDQQNKADLNAYLKNSSLLAGLSTTDDERHAILNGAIERIDSAPLTDNEKALKKNILIHDLAKARMDHLLVIDPSAVMHVDQKDSMLSSKEWLSYQSAAITQFDRKMTLDNLDFKQEKHQYEVDVIHGKYADNPMMLEALRDSNMISEGTYRTGTMFIPPDQRSVNVLQNIIEETSWNSESDLVEFENNWIKGNHTLNSENHSHLMGIIENKRKELRDPQALNGNNLMHTFKDFIASNSQGILKGDPELKLSENLISSTNFRMKHAKTPDEQSKIFSEAKNEAVKILKLDQPRVRLSGPGKGLPQLFIDNYQKLEDDPDLPR
jgi:hypothetical protein